jgi:hypothetical protein
VVAGAAVLEIALSPADAVAPAISTAIRAARNVIDRMEISCLKMDYYFL